MKRRTSALQSLEVAAFVEVDDGALKAKDRKVWLPQPRILHPWPAQRFDVKYPRWEPSA